MTLKTSKPKTIHTKDGVKTTWTRVETTKMLDGIVVRKTGKNIILEKQTGAGIFDGRIWFDVSDAEHIGKLIIKMGKSK